MTEITDPNLPDVPSADTHIIDLSVRSGKDRPKSGTPAIDTPPAPRDEKNSGEGEN